MVVTPWGKNGRERRDSARVYTACGTRLQSGWGRSSLSDRAFGIVRKPAEFPAGGRPGHGKIGAPRAAFCGRYRDRATLLSAALVTAYNKRSYPVESRT